MPIFDGKDCDLTERQEAVYTDLLDIWEVVQAPGENSEDKYTLIARNVPCHYTQTENVDSATGVGRYRQFAIITTDRVHLPIGPPTPNGGWIVKVTPNSPDIYKMHHILGAPQVLPGSARRPLNKQILDIGEDESAPLELLAKYERAG